MSTPIKAIIFDGDDTLWECGEYYRGAERKFREIVSKRTGLTPEFCHRLFELIDGHMITLPDGFDKERFPTTFMATSVALDVIGPNVSCHTLSYAEEAYDIGNSIYEEAYPLYPGVREMLELLSKTSTKLILNTKGADDVQYKKVVDNDVEQYFDDVVITLAKNKEHLQSILDKHDLYPEEVLCVGDSAVDDVTTPQDLGCWTVWISDTHPDNFKPTWIYEEGIKEIHPNWWTESSADLPKVLEVFEGQLIEFLLDFKQPAGIGPLIRSIPTSS